jgi:hypothetical protein
LSSAVSRSALLLLAERGGAARRHGRGYKPVLTSPIPTGQCLKTSPRCPTPPTPRLARTLLDSRPLPRLTHRQQPSPRPRLPHRCSDRVGPKSSSPLFGKPRRRAVRRRSLALPRVPALPPPVRSLARCEAAALSEAAVVSASRWPRLPLSPHATAPALRPCHPNRVAGECRHRRRPSCRCSCWSAPRPRVRCASAGRATRAVPLPWACARRVQIRPSDIRFVFLFFEYIQILVNSKICVQFI